MGGRTDGAGEQLFARSLARSSLIFEAGAAELRKLPSCPSLPSPLSCLEAVSQQENRKVACSVCLAYVPHVPSAMIDPFNIICCPTFLCFFAMRAVFLIQ